MKTISFSLRLPAVEAVPPKQKYLASVEQFTGFFLVDLPPERSADILMAKPKPMSEALFKATFNAPLKLQHLPMGGEFNWRSH